VLQNSLKFTFLPSQIFYNFLENFPSYFCHHIFCNQFFLNQEINFEIQILILFFFTGPFSPSWPTGPTPLFTLSSSPRRSSSPLPFTCYCTMSAPTHLPRHGADPPVEPLFNQVMPPSPLLNVAASPPPSLWYWHE
jgi:hypothetical protein